MLSDDPAEDPETPAALGDVRPDAAQGLLALGTALRRKGDLGRAIRIHQALAGTGELDPALRRTASVELALDHRQAGLLGRALGTLAEVIAAEPGHVEAQRLTRDLHEQLGEWAEAVIAQERLEALGAGTAGML